MADQKFWVHPETRSRSVMNHTNLMMIFFFFFLFESVIKHGSQGWQCGYFVKLCNKIVKKLNTTDKIKHFDVVTSVSVILSAVNTDAKWIIKQKTKKTKKKKRLEIRGQFPCKRLLGFLRFCKVPFKNVYSYKIKPLQFRAWLHFCSVLASPH